uniref:Uncharacterized protein n=1 Tax=Rhizophora mucronata TaxID=61149 RepID=A0A2P2MQA1_RHIMU
MRYQQILCQIPS